MAKVSFIKSKHESRKFHSIWRVVSRIADKKGGAWDGFVSVGEVATEAEVSRTTALKYMKMLCLYDKVCHHEYKGVSVFQVLEYAEGYK